jgi:hypothetical protein
MKYRTKKERLIAIFDGYLRAHGVTEAAMEDVAVWAIAEGLWPVPTRGEPEAFCLAWEEHLASLIHSAPAANERSHP